MRSVKMFVLSTVLAVAAAASAQMPNPLPPAPDAGQNYWYGPGPVNHNLQSWVQDSGGFVGYDSVYYPGGLVFGNAYGTFGPGYIQAHFNAPTVINVGKYIYIDGYFGVTATVGGFNDQTLNIGYAKFYVLHNSPVQLDFLNFTDANAQFTVGPNGSSVIEMNYQADVHAYGLAGNPLLTSVTFSGGGSAPSTINLSPDVDTGFAAEVKVHRIADVKYNNPAGQYAASGVVRVTMI